MTANRELPICVNLTYRPGQENAAATQLFREHPQIRETLGRLGQALVSEYELTSGRILVVADVPKDRLAQAVRDLNVVSRVPHVGAAD